MNDALNRPRAERQPCPPHKVAARNSKQTLRELFTQNETKTNLISVLKNLALTHKNGPWVEYWNFYKTNQSGDMDSMNADTKKYVKKFIADVVAKHAEMQKVTE